MKYLIILNLIFLFSCTSKIKKEYKTLTVGDGKDVDVILNVEKNEDIEKIEFSSKGNLIVIKKDRIKTYNQFIYNFENAGEGTFKTCIFKLNDTICTESYVERGYSPKIKFEKDSIVFTDFM